MCATSVAAVPSNKVPVTQHRSESLSRTSLGVLWLRSNFCFRTRWWPSKAAKPRPLGKGSIDEEAVESALSLLLALLERPVRCRSSADFDISKSRKGSDVNGLNNAITTEGVQSKACQFVLLVLREPCSIREQVFHGVIMRCRGRVGGRCLVIILRSNRPHWADESREEDNGKLLEHLCALVLIFFIGQDLEKNVVSLVQVVVGRIFRGLQDRKQESLVLWLHVGRLD